MGLLHGTRRSLLGGKAVVPYLVRVWMSSPITPDQGYADAQILNTLLEGVKDGVGRVVEVDGVLFVTGGKLTFTAQATPAWGAQGHWWQAIARVLGRGLLYTIELNQANKACTIGLTNNADIYDGIQANSDVALRFSNTGALFDLETLANLTAYIAATDYEFALVLGGYDANGVPWRVGQVAASYLYGFSIFIMGSGAFTNWTLLWRSRLKNAGTLYANFSNSNANGKLSNFIVPGVDLSAVLQPMALSTFTAPDGTDLAAGYTPEVGGVFTERTGNFDIQTNRANISVSTGTRDVATVDAAISDLMADVTIRKTAAVDSGEFGRCLRYSDVNNYWMAQGDLSNNQVELVERNGGVENVRASAAVVLTHSTDYDVRAITYGRTIDIFLKGGNKATYALAALNENATIHGIVGNQVNQTFDNYADYARQSSVYDSVLGGV